MVVTVGVIVGLYCQVPAGLSGQAPGDEQAQTGTGFLFPANHFRGPSSIEQMLYILLTYTKTVVPNAYKEMGWVLG